MQHRVSAAVQPQDQRRPGWFGRLALASVLVLIALVIRIGFLNEPLWIDELHTAWVANGSTSDVAHRAGQGNQTPLYFWLMHAVCLAAGLTESALRWPSLVLSMVMLLASFHFVWLATHRLVAAVLSTSLIAVDPWCIFYATEARPYILLQCLCILQAFGWLTECRSGSAARAKRINWLLTVTTAAMLWTHLTSLFLIVAQLAGLMLAGHRMNRRRILSSFLLALSTCWPLIELGCISLGKSNDWNSVSSAYRLLTEIMPYLLAYILLPAGWLGCHRWFGGRACKESNAEGTLIVVVCGGLGSIAVVGMLDGLDALPVAQFRYVAASWIFLPMFAGLLVGRLGRSRQQLALAAMILIASVAAHPMLPFITADGAPPRYRYEDWRSAVARLQTIDVGNRPLVFLFANLIEDVRGTDPANGVDVSYLAFPLTSIYPLPDRARIVPMPTQTSKRWSSHHLDRIIENGGAQIVARVPPNLLNSILDELARSADEAGTTVHCRVQTQPRNLISVVQVHAACAASRGICDCPGTDLKKQLPIAQVLCATRSRRSGGLATVDGSDDLPPLLTGNLHCRTWKQ